MKKVVLFLIVVLLLSSFFYCKEMHASNKKSNAESNVTITFIESSKEHEDTIIQEFKDVNLKKNSSISLPNTGSKENGVIFILGIVSFIISINILLGKFKKKEE
ncbi:LPXTG cell wall anchor domain-containing protein [Enterococcus sp. AN402]|uniref:LPXTG cell wall anchor domain-containing protein n=1 Tax=Enterococcus sp. AN402 TaxID=3151386 RepID=UPI00345B4A24